MTDLLAFTPDPLHGVIVTANPTGEVLGWINWNQHWQQRCFRPRLGTIWSAPLLRDVAQKIDELPAQPYAVRPTGG